MNEFQYSIYKHLQTNIDELNMRDHVSVIN